MLFGFFVPLWLVSSGAQQFVMPSMELLKLLPQPVVVLILVAGSILQAIIGLIQLQASGSPGRRRRAAESLSCRRRRAFRGRGRRRRFPRWTIQWGRRHRL